MKLIKLTFLIVVIGLTSCKTTKYPDLSEGLYADVQTSKGDILLQLEYNNTPVTVANFVSLADGTNPYVNDDFKGKPFYDGLKFHRVIEDFMIQGGDPRGNGSGDPGYKFEDEFPLDDQGNLLLKHDKPGILSMANSGPASNGSQFFITHKETAFLDGRHTVFGHVVVGQEVVDSIKQDDLINKITIIRVGKDAEGFNAKGTFEKYFSKLLDQKRKVEETREKAKADLLQMVKDKEAEAKILPSGLKIIYLKKGPGKKPAMGSQVNVNYAGYFTTADLFDTNIKEIAQGYGKYDERRNAMNGYEPVPMDYSIDAQLISGFREGLLNMNYGDKVMLIIPSHLGYGEQGMGGVIPPNADLLFELEILEN
jgi:peptidyl-prolyl cis-trans isomerase A (cyclophilin A)